MSDDEHAFLPNSRLPLAMALRKKAAQAEDSSEPTSHQIGLSAEGRAAAFLKGRGYRILFRRWRSPVGEIDIIAMHKRTLVFVEVKARANLDDAAYAILPKQQQRIVAAAESWLSINPYKGDMRFDAILVAPNRAPLHIPNAFDASA